MPRTKPDIRRIRWARSYTVTELAITLKIATGTVRRWVRDGMPLIDKERPKLVNGAEFLAWHRSRRNSRKIKCGSRQMYCCKCRTARNFMPGTAVTIHRNEKSATIKALCIACGTALNRHCSRQNAAEWIDLARFPKGPELHLVASAKPLVNVTFAAPSEAKSG